jgi:glycosyltransferase involved in cell wall biosynthesis
MHLIALEQEPTSLRGGQERNLLEICRGLSERGHRVTLLYEREGNLLEQYREFCEYTHHIDAYGFDRRKPKNILQFVRNVAGIGKIQIHDDSIVFSNVCHTVTFGYALSRLRGLPFVCYFQIPACDLNRQIRFALDRVDHYITVSHQTKRSWLEYGLPDSKIEVIQNATDPNKFKPADDLAALRNQRGIPEATRIVSFVGRIDHDKGIESLIKAFGLLHQQGVDAQLLIAGKPVLHYDAEKGIESPEAGERYVRSLKQLASENGVGNLVKFLGHTDPVPVYQISDVNVVCSVWEEPFARVILESMSCGTPLVGSRIGGTVEALTGEFERGLFTPGDEQDLARSLAETIQWRERDPGLGARYREHIIQHFSLERLIDDFEVTLSKIAQKRKVAA